MPALRELFAEYLVKFNTKELDEGAEATGKADRKLDELDDTAKKVSRGIAAFGGAIAAVFTAGAVQNMISSTINATNELARWGQRLNTNVAEVTAWTRIAEPFGASVDDVTDAFKELQLKAQDAISGGTSQAEMFQRIGISLSDLRPVVNDVNGLMNLFVGRLNNVNDAGLRNFTVDELMSDAGTRMLPVFMQGTERLRELRTEMVAGAGATIKLSERMGSWNTTSARVKSSLENLKASVVLSILPALERAADATVNVVKKFQEILEKSDLIKTAMPTLAAAIVGVGIATAPVWGPMALTIAGVVAVVVILVAVVNDLWVTIKGGDSITRRFIDGMFGVGATANAIEKVVDTWRRLKIAMEETARFIASTPILNNITGGIFERSLASNIDQNRALQAARDQRTGALTLGRIGQLFTSNYQERNARIRAERPRRMALAEERRQREMADVYGLGSAFYDQPSVGQMSIPEQGAAIRDEDAAVGMFGVAPSMSLTGATSPGGVTQNNNIAVTVNGGGDPRQTAEEVRRVVREENERQLRQTRAALVPGAA